MVVLAGLGLLLGGRATAVAHPSGDPFRGEQWSLDRLRADEAWDTSRGADVVVAVVDTGVAVDHPDLFDRIAKHPDGSVVGVDLVDGGLDPSDRHGHGTLVAGVIAATADNGWGIAGVAPEAIILPVRVLDADGSGRSEDVGRGIRWAVDHGADVINVSLEAVATGDGTTRAPGVPTDAVRYADERGVLVIAAAGNQPDAAASYPEDSPIILVGAVDRDDRPTDVSAVGRRDGFVAPGVGILSTWCRRTSGGCDVAASPYGVAEGTSFAAPHVSGVAALLVAAGYDAGQVRERLAAGAVDLGDPGPDRQYRNGRVDAAASLAGTPVRARSVPEPAGDGPAEAPSEPASEPTPQSASEPSPTPTGEVVEAVPPSEVEAPPVAEVPRTDAEPVVEPPPDDAPEPAAAAPDEFDRSVALDLALPAPAAVPGHPPGGPARHLWLQLFATALVTASMVCWSSVARATT